MHALMLLQQGVMNGRRPAAALQELQQQDGQHLLMPPGAQLTAAAPHTAVAVADAARDDDSSSTSSVDGTPRPLLHTLQDVSGPTGRVANGAAAVGAAYGTTSLRSISEAGRATTTDGDSSDESLDGSRTTSVQPSVAAIADEVRQVQAG